MIITITLYGTRMAYIFIRVCALVYNSGLPSIFARHCCHQYILQTAEVNPHLRLNAAATNQWHAVRPRSLGPHGIQTGQAHWSAPTAERRGCPNGHAGPTRPLASHQNMAWEFGAMRFISRGSEQDNSAVQSCLAGCTNETTSGCRGRARLHEARVQ